MDPVQPDAPPAAPSAAPEVSSTERLEQLSQTQRDAWRLTGELPIVEPSSSPADSTPAVPAAQVASVDALPSPASKPGSPSKVNAETRVQELLRERHDLRERLAALERPPAPHADATPAASSAAAEPKTLTETIAHPDLARPILTEAEFFSAFPEASFGDLSRYAARYELVAFRQSEQQDREQIARQSAAQTQIETFNGRVSAAMEADPTFWDGITPDVRNLQPLEGLAPGQPPTGYHVLGQEILESEHGPALMRHFSQQPLALHRIAALPSREHIARAIGRLEATFVSSSPALPAPAVTKAPPPPPTLGSRPAIPADDVDAAAKRGDFRAFMDAANRREMTRTG